MNLVADRCHRRCAGIAWAILAFLNANAHGAELPDRAELAAILEHQWSSLVDLEFESEEPAYDGWGKLLFTQRMHLGYGAGGRWLTSVSIIKDGVPADQSEMREDGKLRYQFQYLPGRSDVIHALVITRPQNKPREYRGGMCQALWAFLPGGRPLADRLADAATQLAPVTLESGKEGLKLTAEYRGRSLEIQLDPEHDFLPCRVRLEGSFTLRVTRFGEDNGRYFPIEGEEESERANGPARRTFLVKTLRINRNLPASHFGMPNLDDGVPIIDQVKGNNRVPGRPGARKVPRDRQAPIPESLVISKDAKPTLLIAPQEPARSSPWPWIVGGISLSLLTGALLLRWKGVI